MKRMKRNLKKKKKINHMTFKPETRNQPEVLTVEAEMASKDYYLAGRAAAVQRWEQMAASLEDFGLKEYVSCARKKSGGLRFHVVWTQRRDFAQNPADVSTVIIQDPCTQNYLITVHMFIYNTTTSICAFWTVTKWCFIACCIDDANYNCSSAVLE